LNAGRQSGLAIAFGNFNVDTTESALASVLVYPTENSRDNEALPRLQLEEPSSLGTFNMRKEFYEEARIFGFFRIKAICEVGIGEVVLLPLRGLLNKFTRGYRPA
jgi:hypothetical protein